MAWSRLFTAVVFLFPILFPGWSIAGNYNWGRGTVNIQGSIIDTACAIAVDSRDQTIAIGNSPTGSLLDGQAVSKDLSIQLINCVLERPVQNHPGWKQFQITFDGDVDGDLFGISGNAKGMAIQISDEFGFIARPGKALPSAKIIPGEMTLNYKIKLVANNQVITPGDYFSVIRFKMDYF